MIADLLVFVAFVLKAIQEEFNHAVDPRGREIETYDTHILEMQRFTAQMQVYQQNRVRARELNDQVKIMQYTMQRIQQYFIFGRQFLRPNLEEVEKKRAGECFKVFLGLLYNLNAQSIEIESKLADADESQEKREKTEKTWKIREICDKLSRLVPDRRQIGNMNNQTNEDVNFLEHFMTELVKLMIEFGYFDPQNQQLIDHILAYVNNKDMGLSVAKEEDLYESRDNLQLAEKLFDSNLKQFRNEERLNEIRLEAQRVHFQHIKMMQKLSILEAYKKDEQAEDLRRNANRMQFHYQMFKNCFQSEKRALMTTRANISQGRPLGYIPDIGKIDQLLSTISERLNFVPADGKGRNVIRIVEELKTTLHNIESRIRRYQKNQQRGAGRNLDQFDISEHFELLEELIEKLDEEISEFHVQRTTILDDVLALQAQQQADARRRIKEHSFHFPLHEKNQKLLTITMPDDFD